MEHFGLIDTIKTYCEAHNHVFIAGGDGYRAYVNALVDNEEYANNQLIVFAGFEYTPLMFMNQIQTLTYSGVIGVGRKCEQVIITEDNEETVEDEEVIEETRSSLDETYQQKYDRRLKSLASELITFITAITCANDLEIKSLVLSDKINQFDLNADFVEARITIEQ